MNIENGEKKSAMERQVSGPVAKAAAKERTAQGRGPIGENENSKDKCLRGSSKGDLILGQSLKEGEGTSNDKHTQGKFVLLSEAI